MLLYSYMDDEEEMQIETEDLMRLGVLRGWSFRDWLAELDEQTLRATTEARAHAHAHWRDHRAGLEGVPC